MRCKYLTGFVIGANTKYKKNPLFDFLLVPYPQTIQLHLPEHVCNNIGRKMLKHSGMVGYLFVQSSQAANTGQKIRVNPAIRCGIIFKEIKDNVRQVA